MGGPWMRMMGGAPGAPGDLAPPGFETVVSRPGTRAFLRREYVDLAARAGLHDPDRYLREHGSPSDGRGPLARVPLGPSTALILKKYRRGGALARLLSEVCVGWGRMLADLEASERARSRAVPVAAAAGLILRRRAPGFWSAYLLTEEIPEAVTLARALESAVTVETALRLAQSCVRTVRRLHDAGIIHRDLNLGNVLLRQAEVDAGPCAQAGGGGRGVREPEAFVIDL